MYNFILITHIFKMITNKYNFVSIICNITFSIYLFIVIEYPVMNYAFWEWIIPHAHMHNSEGCTIYNKIIRHVR